MLSMHHVYYSYHKHKKTSNVIIDMSADFEPGKVYAIYGPSGAGKDYLSFFAGWPGISNQRLHSVRWQKYKRNRLQ